MPWHDRTGRGVRVAVVDSGVHATHPHVGGVAGGISLCGDGPEASTDFIDRIGHGTAVAGAIREKVPDAELHVVRIFDRTLSTTAERLVQGIRRAADVADVINLSLGTHRSQHAPALTAAIAYAADRGAVVVAAERSDDVSWMPGSLEGVVPVRLDWECPRNEFRCARTASRVYFLASGYPRPIPGVPQSANLNGVSFAVANMTGIVARAVEEHGALPVADMIELLAASHLTCRHRGDDGS